MEEVARVVREGYAIRDKTTIRETGFESWGIKMCGKKTERKKKNIEKIGGREGGRAEGKGR